MTSVKLCFLAHHALVGDLHVVFDEGPDLAIARRNNGPATDRGRTQDNQMGCQSIDTGSQRPCVPTVVDQVQCVVALCTSFTVR